MRDRLRHLTHGVAIYGAGDATIQIVNFFLLAVYVKQGFVQAADFGALSLIIACETLGKVISRWGLDGAFMRYYHERDDDAGRRRLASTIMAFMIAANIVLFGGAFLASRAIATRLFDLPGYLMPFRLMIANTFFISFTFLPFQVMRLRHQPVAYSAFTFGRHIGTLMLRIVFVIGLRLGITGFYLADILMTAALLPMLWPWCRPLLGRVFSRSELSTALRFGVPRLPHGIAQQLLDAGNKLLLGRFIPQSLLGIYQNDVAIGTTGIKFFTSAFETAWAPFYYETSRTPDAKTVFRKMTTYGIAALALLVAGTTAVAHDIVLVMLKPEYLLAWRVMPLVALAVACQGVYLLTSIGLNLTSRTEFYPVSTFAAAAVGLGSGYVLIARYGVMGAAVAFLLSYLTQTVVAFVLARRFYTIEYERGRIARIVAAAVVAAACGLVLVPPMRPVLAVFARGSVTVVTFGALLWVSGFFRPTERAFLREVSDRFRRRGPREPLRADVD